MGLALAVVRDPREYRAPVSEEELAEFETDVLAGFVRARASAGLVEQEGTDELSLFRVFCEPAEAPASVLAQKVGGHRALLDR
ncbi:hypothetical protein ACFYQ5_28190 [Streptomyces sp. NPDC005794]|uniref:hypothetical protein n=1 Tax=Streptomyces sp. NPDC005794 TaxID=3364733 RepID=UPI00367D2FB2